jgi:hypothetical protein
MTSAEYTKSRGTILLRMDCHGGEGSRGEMFILTLIVWLGLLGLLIPQSEWIDMVSMAVHWV